MFGVEVEVVDLMSPAPQRFDGPLVHPGDEAGFQRVSEENEDAHASPDVAPATLDCKPAALGFSRHDEAQLRHADGALVCNADPLDRPRSRAPARHPYDPSA